MIEGKRFIIPFSFLLLSVLISSCHQQRTTDCYYRFPNQTWSRFEYVNLEFPVKDTRHSYTIFLSVKHTTEYPFENLYINVVMNLPSGEERIQEYDFDMMDKNGSFIGAAHDSLFQVIFPLKQELTFSNEGMCKVEIENLIPKTEISGIVEIGLIIEKAN